MTETAMIYCRVSTEGQGKNYSLPTQLDECRLYCEKRGYRIIGEYSDMHSGEESNRPGMDKLLDAVAVHQTDVAVFLDLDRLGRGTRAQEAVEDGLLRFVQRIEFTDGNAIHADGSGDVIPVAAKRFITNVENEIRVKRSIRGKKGRAESGNPIPTAGKAPYGYDYVSGGKGKGQFIINENEAPIVREIYQWLVMEHVSSYEIARRLHSRGVPTRGDTSITVAKTSGPGEWSPTTIRRIIENSTYKGEWVWGKYRHIKRNGKRRTPIPVPEDQWVKVAVPAIVELSIWDAAQPQLRENKTNATRNTKREYLLRGMIFCTCGRRWTGRFKTNVQRGYYRCPTTEAEGWRCNCDARFSYRVDMLDTVIWDKVTDYLLQPDTMIKDIRRLREANTTKTAEREWRLAAKRKRLSEVEAKLGALLSKELSGYPQSVLESEKQRLLDEHREKTEDIARLESERRDVDITPDTENMLLSLSQDMKDALPAMTFGEKRRVLELLRIRIDVVDRDTVRLSGIISGPVVDMRNSSRR